MNRKEFLFSLWNKFFAPLIWITALVCFFNLIREAIATNGPERFLFFAIGIFGLLYVLFGGLAVVVKAVTDWLRPRLPDVVIRTLHYLGKVVNYLMPFILGAIFYDMWQKDWVVTAIVIACMLLQKLINLYDEMVRPSSNTHSS